LYEKMPTARACWEETVQRKSNEICCNGASSSEKRLLRRGKGVLSLFLSIEVRDHFRVIAKGKKVPFRWGEEGRKRSVLAPRGDQQKGEGAGLYLLEGERAKQREKRNAPRYSDMIEDASSEIKRR